MDNTYHSQYEWVNKESPKCFCLHRTNKVSYLNQQLTVNSTHCEAAEEHEE